MSGDRLAVVLRPPLEALARHPGLYGQRSADHLGHLAQALTATPGWSDLRRRAVIAVRPSAGIVAIIGEIAPEEQPLLRALVTQVPDLLERLRPVDYPEVQEACVDLAGRIREVLSLDRLGRSHLSPIPRGGHVVAGLLAYALEIPAARIGTAAPAGGTTIIVDDCAISGARLAGRLRATAADDDIVIALLHAHPDLAATVTARYPAVRACLAARDLVDHAPARPDHADWVARWRARHPDDLWTGEPHHVVYPWNEPDVVIWNEVTGRSQASWRVVPPSWCLKHRPVARPGDVQICQVVPGRVVPETDVVWGSLGDDMLIAGGTSGDVIATSGVGAAIWSALVATADPGAATERVARAYGADPARVGPDVERLVDDLATRGFVRVSS